MKCYNCGRHNEPLKNGKQRKLCTYCLKPLEEGAGIYDDFARMGLTLMDNSTPMPASNINEWREQLPTWAKNIRQEEEIQIKAYAQKHNVSEKIARKKIVQLFEIHWETRAGI